MKISSNFNRYYHAFLNEVFTHTPALVFKDFIEDTPYGQVPFRLVKYEDYHDMNEMKQWLKTMNLDYAVKEDGSGKISTTQIDSAALVQHLEFIYKTVADSGIILPSVELEWKRTIEAAKGW